MKNIENVNAQLKETEAVVKGRKERYREDLDKQVRELKSVNLAPIKNGE